MTNINITTKDFYYIIAALFLSIAISRIIRIIPFYSIFILILFLFISLLLISKDGKIKYPAIGSSLGFFLEIYKIDINYFQEMLEFLLLGILVIGIIIFNGRKKNEN